jgi:Lsr2
MAGVCASASDAPPRRRGAHPARGHQALGKYIERSRKVGGTTRRSPRSHRGAAAIDTAKVREWAKGNGYDIKDRGGVSADLVAKYQAVSGA